MCVGLLQGFRDTQVSMHHRHAVFRAASWEGQLPSRSSARNPQTIYHQKIFSNRFTEVGVGGISRNDLGFYRTETAPGVPPPHSVPQSLLTASAFTPNHTCPGVLIRPARWYKTTCCYQTHCSRWESKLLES